MNRNERIATIEDFGQQLLVSGDLDPLYIALAGAEMDRDQLRRWLFCYWCCYSSGAASWISEHEGAEYWHWFWEMTANVLPSPLGERWPRGHERRHFRGQKALDAVTAYQKIAPKGAVETLVVDWEGIDLAYQNFSDLREKVMRLPQFGPWIAFKVADMLERVMGVRINFNNADVLMYDQPYKSALIVWETQRWEYPIPTVSPNKSVKLVGERLIEHFSSYLAPPHRDRPVNIQEVETILCKWKSHNGGSYPMGLDTHELREGLEQWATVSTTAARLLEAAPK